MGGASLSDFLVENMQLSSALVLLCATLSSCLWLVSCTKTKGSLSYDLADGQNSLFFLDRFGVGKGQEVYAYGTLQRSPDDLIGLNSLMVLAFLPQGIWDEFYGQVKGGDDKCNHLISTVLNDSILMGDSRCPVYGTKDNLRKVPCDHPNGDFKTCNQPDRVDPIAGADITFHIPSAPETEYYYMFLISCTRNFSSSTPCVWGDTDKLTMQYDINLVNNRPNETNRYTSEFPYNLQGALTLQLFFSILYIALVAVHFLLHSRFCVKDARYKIHFLIKAFTLSLILESLYVMLELLHYSVYAANGIGVVALKYIGEVANQFSDWLLILVVILVGKGWQVTTSSLRWSKVTMIIWGMYIFFSAIYFIWTVVSFIRTIRKTYFDALGSCPLSLVWRLSLSWRLIYTIEGPICELSFVERLSFFRKVPMRTFSLSLMQISEQLFPLSISLYYGYQSYVGGLYLGYRLFILIYLLYEMRQVYQIENRPTALALYIILAVCYVIWFCYLPLLTLFALLADPVRRLVGMLSVYLVFDFLINLGMVILFCPRWTNKFFQFDNYINSLSDSSKYVYKSLKSYGNTAAPI